MVKVGFAGEVRLKIGFWACLVAIRKKQTGQCVIFVKKISANPKDVRTQC